MWNLTYKPQSSLKENDSSGISFFKARWKLNFFFPCLIEQNAWMGLSGLWNTLLNVLDQQWELIQSKKKKCQQNIS